MDKHVVIEKLRAHESELRAAGIVHLRVFGSVARGGASTQSDIDLMADFDRSKRLSLVSMVRMEYRLADILGAKVDLCSATSMKESVRKNAIREAASAF